MTQEGRSTRRRTTKCSNNDTNHVSRRSPPDAPPSTYKTPLGKRRSKLTSCPKSFARIQCVLQNLHKSCTTSSEIREYLLGLKGREYLAFLTEPGLGQLHGSGQKTPRCLPGSPNTFYCLNGTSDIRSCIIADASQEMDLLPQFTSPDVVTVLWRTGIKHLKRSINVSRRRIIVATSPGVRDGNNIEINVGSTTNNITCTNEIESIDSILGNTGQSFIASHSTQSNGDNFSVVAGQKNLNK